MQTDTSNSSRQLASAQSAPSQAGLTADNAALAPSLTATAPGQLKVIKRNGTVVPYTDDKIAVAMT